MSHQVPKGRVALIATILFFAFFLTTEVTHAEVTPGDTGNFITTWNTENPGTSANNQITIPGTGGGYNYDVYWVNTASSTQTGTTTTTSSSLTLTFPEPGIYQVEIAGAFPRIFFNNGGDRQKILTVEQWGDIAWNSMDRAFNGASNLRVPASDAPDLSGVTSMYRMFRAATVFNDPVNHWDVSNVDTINGLFWEAANFNQSLNDWNISSATNISNAFRGAIQFNQPLDNWDTSLVFSMSSMFSGAIQFNQDLSNWNISSITPDANCSANDGMCNIFLGVALSTHNLDATLQSWAQQAVDNNIQNIPLHLGLKTYSQTGATAIQTLRDLGWTVDEQYKATYSPSTRATLLGQGTQSPLNSNDTTTSVTIKPDNRCTFTRWSDGNTDNPRTDTLVDDNLAVTAVIHCPSSGGTTLATRITNLENSGNQVEADKLRAQFQLTTTTTTTQTTPVTLEDTITAVRTLLDQPLPTDQSKAKELLSLLLELVKALSQLLLTTALTSEVTTE